MSQWYRQHFVLLSLLAALLVGCSHSEETQEDAGSWTYSGDRSKEHWAEIEEYLDCGGDNQSPVNLIEFEAIKVSQLNSLRLFYSPATHISKVINNGHTIEFDFVPGDSIIFNEMTYHLDQIHFHEPGEHKINGIRYPIEIHLVHRGSSGDVCVLGILGMEGQESQIFEFLEQFLPLKERASKRIDRGVDLSLLLPESLDYFSYVGSLTTPPCSEEVNWIVFRDPIILSLEEVEKLQDNMPVNNFREEQPLNGRLVYLNEMGQ